MSDDYLLEDLERSQLDATRRRRSLRSRRFQRLMFATVGFIALVVLATPSIFSHTGIARSMFASAALSYGWEARTDSINVGWITPLSIEGVELIGPSQETVIRIDRADTALTVTSLIGFDFRSIGDVSFRGVSLDATVDTGTSSLETDLAKLIETETDSKSNVVARVQLHDVSATITDRVDSVAWVLDQSNANLDINGQRVEGDLAGVLHEPSGHGGALQSKFVWNPGAAAQPNRQGELTQSNWELSIQTDSFPLSVTNLISRRFADSGDNKMQSYAGDTTGRVTIAGLQDGSVRAGLGDVRIRDLRTTSSETGLAQTGITQWKNSLATLDGEVLLSQHCLIGRQLEITTDFASATLNGSLPTTISLVGIDDNPMRWLQTLEGRAEIDVDLAKLNQAMPGLIPLRENATLVSGRARGLIENSFEGSQTDDSAIRRSELTLSSNSLRARSSGRIVVIDPIKVTATVSDRGGALVAERFDLDSSFASASGSGSLQSGSAEVEIDFGRLYTILRPVIDLSELSLGGTAGGKLTWSVNPSTDGGNDRWELDGSGEAQNLLVTLPNGYRFKRSVLQGDLSAVGQWDGKALDELSSTRVAVRSGGISMSAELTDPVVRPTSDSVFPIRLETDGRMEYLSESLRPWLPAELASAEGRLTGWAAAKVSRARGVVTQASAVLNQPNFNYANQWYSQPQLDIRFGGVLDWPSGSFQSQETTIVGRDLSVAIRGEASRENTNLDIAWDADLAGIQSSVGSTIARAAAKPTVRPISFRPVRQESYRFEGTCKGKATVKDAADGQWEVDCSATASNLVVYAPSEQQIIPPGTPRTGTVLSHRSEIGQQLVSPDMSPTEKPLWYEPRLKFEGPIQYQPDQGRLSLAGLQVACDWFASTLSGDVTMKGDRTIATRLNGPSRLQMEIVAQRLSTLFGIPVRAQGIHEAPISIQSELSPAGDLTLNLECELGWEQIEVSGIRFGEGKLPVRASQREMKIAKTTLPILALDASRPGAFASAERVGTARLSGLVDYSNTPTTIRFEPGSRIESLRVTPQTGAGWLKYLAPLAADATTIDGDLSIEFDRADVVVGDLPSSVVQGTLDIRSMRLASGPLANQVIQGVKSIKSLVKLAGGRDEASGPITLIEMPPQTVEFSFANSIATHQRMYFQIDRAQAVTSGRVSTNSQIDLVALVPLDARWLGGDLKGLAGQTLTFPITGTLSRPRLDDTAVRDVMTRLGTQASSEVIQNGLNDLLQKQLGSGMEQINSGLGKILGL